MVDEKGRGENKHRYVVASQDQRVRRYMRGVSGVPLIYIVRAGKRGGRDPDARVKTSTNHMQTRSVMIMEPMSETTSRVGVQAERAKFRSELRKSAGEKRKRNEDGDGDSENDDDSDSGDSGDSAVGDADKGAVAANRAEEKKKKKKAYGPKGPNPLSIKKKKPAPAPAAGQAGAPKARPADDGAPKKKRKRKHKAKTDDGPTDGVPAAEA